MRSATSFATQLAQPARVREVSADFLQLWDELCAAHPRDQLPEASCRTYYKRLRRFDQRDLEQAVGRCLEELKFFPKISEIVERVPRRRPDPVRRPSITEEQRQKNLTAVREILANLGKSNPREEGKK